MVKQKKRVIFGSLITAYLLLMISAPTDRIEPNTRSTPFVWNSDKLWAGLEDQFIRAKALSRDDLQAEIDARSPVLASLIEQCRAAPRAPEDPIWDRIEDQLFICAPLFAALPEHLPLFIKSVENLQMAVKRQSQNWLDQSQAARHRLYRLLYGSRTALEQIMLQTSAIEAVTHIHDEYSRAPGIEIHGVRLRSGDILVSRGGAATSALIARGNDYPGNFSHVALLYVDPETRAAYVIEALIESGLVVSSFENYLKDKKLRIMALRLRSDLPEQKDKPLLAHQAALHAYRSALQGPVDYDFLMDYQKHDKLFCSEVVYAAYEKEGIHLWRYKSTISESGTAQWLAAFGVRRFETLEPSDLEYDPRLIKIAEWRDPDTLFKDAVDNAATDALLVYANQGRTLRFNRFLLPPARLVKSYSLLLNAFGARGPIPKGMSAAAALRNKWYAGKHAVLVEEILAESERFKTKNAYTPPYWVLVKIAKARVSRL